MFDLFEVGFMQRALIASLLIGLLASFFSVFVVQRKMSFLGSGLAHAAFGGIALGLLLEIKPIYIAIPFTILVALLIEALRKKSKLNADTVIGVFFSISMAMGIVFLSLRERYSADAMSFLFGSILSVDERDLWIGGLLFAVCLLCLPLWRNWAYASFDAELARADRVPVARDNLILIVLLAVTVVISSKILGIILMAASLVIPGAAARLVSHNFSSMTLMAIVIGIMSSFVGLVASYYLDIPSGATIILCQAFIFFLCLVLRKLIIRLGK